MVTLPGQNIKITFPDPVDGQTHWATYVTVPTLTTPPDTRTWLQKRLYRAFTWLGGVFQEWMYKSFDIADNWAKPSAVRTGDKHIKILTTRIED